MLHAIGLVLNLLLRCFRSRRSLMLENLTLRQQLVVFKRKQPRPRLFLLEKLFWVLVDKFWSGWKKTLIVVSPDTAVGSHRADSRCIGERFSRARRVLGRRQITKEVRDLMFKTVAENPTWGAPRIHGELLMLGFEVSEQTISRWMR